MFDEDKLTSSSVKVLDMDLDDFLITQNSSIEWLNNLVEESVNYHGEATRESFLVVVRILSELLEKKFKIKLPYVWGGGHTHIYGKYSFNDINSYRFQNIVEPINAEWGSPFDEVEREKYKYNDGTIYTNYGPDCTGLVLCSMRLIGIPMFERNTGDLVNGILDYEENELYLPFGDIHVFNQSVLDNLPNRELFNEHYTLFDRDIYFGKPGDLLQIPGHVRIITEVDEENGVYYTTESKGTPDFSVMRTKISLSEILESGKYSLVCLDDVFKQYHKYIYSNNLVDYLENCVKSNR